MTKRLTFRNAAAVFAAVMILDKTTRASVLRAFDSTLNDLLDADVFGTEGQIDPRGDRRE